MLLQRTFKCCSDVDLQGSVLCFLLSNSSLVAGPSTQGLRPRAQRSVALLAEAAWRMDLAVTLAEFRRYL